MNLVFAMILAMSASLGVHSAISDNGLYYIINEFTGKPLDCGQNLNGQNLIEITSSIKTSSAQVFQLTSLVSLGSGWYKVKCMNNGYCWDICVSCGYAIGSGLCYSSDNQNFKFVAAASGYENSYEIQVQYLNRWIDVDATTDGSPLKTDTVRDSTGQHYFILVPVADWRVQQI
eukprot:137332_1